MSERVLVVDDDTNLQTLLHVLLSRAGFSVEFAPDGPSGLRKLQSAAYDAVVLDLLTPALTGLDLLAQMQREKPDMLRKVIVVSGAPPVTLAKARQFPVGAVLRKPFDILEFVETVRACATVCI